MAEQTLKDMKKDIYLMMHKAGQMLELTEDAFMKNKASALDEARDIALEIKSKEDALTEKLAKSAPGSTEARAILVVPSHIEKIAVSIERVMDNVRLKIKEGLLFSDKAIQETGTLLTKGKEVLKKAGEAMVTGSGASGVADESDEIIRLADAYATSHENRLVTGECSPKSSSTYLCILYAFDDIASHTKEALKKITN